MRREIDGGSPGMTNPRSAVHVTTAPRDPEAMMSATFLVAGKLRVHMFSIRKRPLDLARSTMRLTSPEFMPMGFSHRTCFPFSRASRTRAQWCVWMVPT